MRAVFRADASREIGGGHVQRSLTLADALMGRGWRVAFATRADTLDAVPAIAATGVELHVLDHDEAEEADEIRGRWRDGCDLLVIDHYGRDAAFERRFRGWARRILAIDDLAERPHDSDVLLDQTAHREAADYRGLVPAHARLLLGAEYALLRPEFERLRPRALAERGSRGRVDGIMVSLGTADPNGVTCAVLEGIAGSGIAARVDLVLGSRLADIAAIRAATERLSQPVEITVAAADMAARMARADLAVGAAGTTAWERCAMGLPSLLVVLADNQRRIAETLQACGAAEIVAAGARVSADAVAEALRRIDGARERLAAMARAAAAICDGHGCARVVAAVTEGL